MNKFINYIKEVKIEIGKVDWPSKEKALNQTKVVVAMSIAVGAFLTISDYVLSEGAKFLLKM